MQDEPKWHVGGAEFYHIVCRSVLSGVFRMVYQQWRCEVCAAFIEADISENFGGT